MKIKNSQKNRGKGLSTFFLALAFLLFGFSDIQAGINPVEQASVRISGTVTSAADGLGLPGVSIVVKGTSVGTVTNMDGNYSINVAPDATLVFSFIGFSTQEIPVQGRNTINVVMEESIEALEEVVVTALGIRREEKSLGYSVGKVSSEELSKVVNENLLTSMAGKVTGVTINSTGGAGSSVSMIIRGATSLSTDNQPLYVVDGVPMTSGVGNVGGFGRDNRVDYGSAISDIDPESIESISILKGPSAAALYGTRAGNGVVLITTKKASRKEGMRIEVVSNTVFDIPSRYLDVQTRFGFGARSYTPDNFADGIIPPFSPAEAAGAGPELDKGTGRFNPLLRLMPTDNASRPNWFLIRITTKISSIKTLLQPQTAFLSQAIPIRLTTGSVCQI